ncbi:PQQ-dependent sugar dehydrogenase [Streptomyces sannanensis]|uniref:PQQ-dependent sugar dehydrogenase n=1 Tax=Streptomyces sannanensis TaxID=285536 RepID=UPI0031E52630
MSFVGPGSAASASPAAHAVTEPGAVKTVTSGLTTPWGMAMLPDGSALIAERETFRLFKISPTGEKSFVGSVPRTMTTRVEDGVLGIAASNNWEHDHYIFVLHTAPDGNNRIARMTFDGSRLGDYRLLLTGIKWGEIHNGGRLRVGPDGYLYASTGEANKSSLAQNKNSLNGKILRMTFDGRPAPGNPFKNYVFSYGHRNPEGLAFDAQGRLWASEISSDKNDELNLIEAGKNYGWPTCVGPCDVAGMTNPKAYWRPSEASPSGLTYADGSLYMAAMRGRRLWRIPVSGTTLGTPVAYYTDKYGRLRTVEKVPGRNALWLSTTNTDRNGGKSFGEDKVLEVELTAPAASRDSGR